MSCAALEMSLKTGYLCRLSAFYQSLLRRLQCSRGLPVCLFPQPSFQPPLCLLLIALYLFLSTLGLMDLAFAVPDPAIAISGAAFATLIRLPLSLGQLSPFLDHFLPYPALQLSHPLRLLVLLLLSPFPTWLHKLSSSSVICIWCAN